VMIGLAIGAKSVLGDDHGVHTTLADAPIFEIIVELIKAGGAGIYFGVGLFLIAAGLALLGIKGFGT
jgi:hypothetical protein